MEAFKQRIAEAAARALGLEPSEALSLIETPKDPSLGDLALPCFVPAKRLRKNPVEIARDAAAALLPQAAALALADVRATGPYLNFVLDAGALTRAVVGEVLARGAAYGTADEGTGKTVVVDYSSPNIAKPFGIHHLRSTVIGAALVRILRARGYRVVGVNHLGDWGTQFGQLIVAYRRHGDAERLAREGIPYLLELYVGFNRELEAEPSLIDEARAAFRDLERGEPGARELWKRFREVSEAEFRRIYDVLGIRFEAFTGESFFEDRMAPIVAELEQKGLLTLSRDAKVVDLEAEGLGVAVIKKADDASLYVTRDLAAADFRHAEYGFHKALYVVGGAQSLHFQQLVKVLEKLGRSFAKDVVHVPFGLLRFKDRKMSTRKGDILLLEEVLDGAVLRAREIIRAKNPDLQRADETARAIGIGAVVFNDLKNRRVRDVTFDWDEVLSFEGETGPYLQYCHARIASVLRKAGRGEGDFGGPFDFSLLASAAEKDVVRLLGEYPRALARAAAEYEPSLVADHLLALGAALNRFYIECRVLGVEPELSAARLALIRAVQLVLKNGLQLLGIEAPDEM